MTKRFTKTITLFLLLFVLVSSQRAFSQCFQIESILVAACSPTPNTEGYNEMVRFRVGPLTVNTALLTVNWPSNTWQGLIQNTTTSAKVATLNTAIDAAGGCGNLLEPVNGVLFANYPVILVTSYLMDTNSNPFGALAEDTYIIFQDNPSATGGHFGNYNATPGLRTLTMSLAGCSDTVTYQRADLTGSIGDVVLFTPSGTPSYENYGCSAPVAPFSVDAGVPSTSPACPGTTVSLLGTAEGEQSVAWSASIGTFSDPTLLATNYTIPANATAQNITITLTATNSCGVPITDTTILTVSNSTTPTFTLPTTLCNGATAPALPTTSNNGVTGTWSPATISNTADGSYVFTPTAGQCAAAFNLNVTIQSTSTPVTGFSYPTQICSTSTSVFPTPAAGFTTGGSYSVNVSGLTINTTTGEINASTSTPGTYIVTYGVTSSGGCNSGGSSPFTVEITSIITPVVGFSYPANICKNSTSVMPILDPGFTPGGIFTSDTGLTINPATGEVNPSTSTAAPHSVIYTVAANPATCLGANAGPALITFVAEVTPVVSFSYPAQVCANSTPVSPTTAPGFTPGGTFASDPGLIINPTTGEVNIASSTVGPHTITYTVLADPSICQGGDSSSEPLEITSSITPVTAFSYTSPVCTTNAPLFPVTATGFTTGGTYTTNDPGLIINPNTGEINVVASTPGSYIVTYTVTADPSICRSFGDDTFPVVIQSLSTPVVSFTYPTPVCPNAAPVNPTLAPGFTPGGMFISDAGLSINPTTGQINVVASTPGNHLVTYTVLQNNTTCTAGDSDDFNFMIDATAALTPIIGDPSLCMGETLQLTNATPGGTWSSSDESIATVDANGLVTGIAADFVDIIYTLNNGCATDTSIRLTVSTIPQPLLEDRYLCISNVTGLPFNSVRIHCGVPDLNHTFVWTLDGNPLPTTTSTHVATELGVYEVTVTNTISGCSNTTSCEVFESSTAIATATVGEDFSQNQTITVNVTGGSGVYLFQLDHGVPQESNVFPFAYQGEYTITVIDKNGCQDLEFTIFALNYPRFFTPNGDGYNDTWGIKGLTDLNAKTYIFDRFGKLVKFLNASVEEWDGTLNGNQLPSTDYWFLLEYKNRDGIDKEFKAHFSMKR